MGTILFINEIKYQEYVCHTKDAQRTVRTFDHSPDNRVFNIDCEHLTHVPKAKESFREFLKIAELWHAG